MLRKCLVVGIIIRSNNILLCKFSTGLFFYLIIFFSFQVPVQCEDTVRLFWFIKILNTISA